MIGWFRRHSARCAFIEADAKALIERFGEQAYSEPQFDANWIEPEGPNYLDRAWPRAQATK